MEDVLLSSKRARVERRTDGSGTSDVAYADTASIGFPSRGCRAVNLDFVTGTVSGSIDGDETFTNIAASDVLGDVHFSRKTTILDMSAGNSCVVPTVHGPCILPDSATPVL